MSALTILLIRHGEKPAKPGEPPSGPGLTALGVADKHSLTVRGWQRAGSWAALFGSGIGGPDYPKPEVIYAANPDQVAADNADPAADDSVSKRPWETITPLCDRLHLAPVTQHGVGHETAMLDDIRKLTGVVLICWEHKKIVEAILPELAKGQALPQLPKKWKGSRFDVVLRFDRAQAGGQWSFRQLSPRLLSGDSDRPVSEEPVP